MKEGREPEYPEKTPGDELRKMPPFGLLESLQEWTVEEPLSMSPGVQEA